MKILLQDPQANRQEWLALRAGKIGASQAAQVLGFSETRSPLEAWLQIMGKDEQPDSETMWAGRMFEKACAEAWSLREKIIIAPSPGLLEHPHYPWLVGTPDFLYDKLASEPSTRDALQRAAEAALPSDPTRGVLEVKWLNTWAEADWIAQPPLPYVIQLQLYLELAGLDEGTLAVVFGGQRLHSVRLVKDEILIGQMLESLEEWHAKYILGNTPPPPRGEDVSAWIKLNPRDSGEIVALDDGERPLIEELEAVRSAKSAAEKRENELKAILAARCGDASAALCSDGYGITFRAQDVNHRAKEAYTSTSRVMRVTRKGLR